MSPVKSVNTCQGVEMKGFFLAGVTSISWLPEYYTLSTCNRLIANVTI